MKTRKLRRLLLICLIAALGLCLLGAGIVFGIDAYVLHSTSAQMLTTQEAALLEDVDCKIGRAHV